jgi:hypothetical protein
LRRTAGLERADEARGVLIGRSDEYIPRHQVSHLDGLESKTLDRRLEQGPFSDWQRPSAAILVVPINCAARRIPNVRAEHRGCEVSLSILPASISCQL